MGMPSEFPSKNGRNNKRTSLSLVDVWDLDETPYTFPDGTPVSVRELLSSMAMITGQRGSGKSSGSLSALVISLMEYGCGGLFLCSTPEDRYLYLACAAKANALDRVILFNPQSGLRINVPDYIFRTAGKAAGEVENVLRAFMRLYDIVGTGEAKNDTQNAYFRDEAMKLLRFCITLLALAGEPIRILSILKIIRSIPVSPSQAGDEEWRNKSYSFDLIRRSENNRRNPQDYHEHSLLVHFMEEWISKGSENRSDVTTTLTSKLEPIVHGAFFRMFSQDTNIVPDLTFTFGAIIIVDISVEGYGVLGKMANVLWKSALYEALKQRDMRTYPRPICLVQDEAHLTVLKEDITEALPVMRSKGCIVISATQSLLNFDVAFEDKTLSDDYIALFNLRIHHANSDNTRTNRLASESIGQEIQTWRLPPDLPTGPEGLDVGALRHQKHIYYKFPPEKFNSDLMRAGPPEFKTGAAVVMSGKKFVSTGEHWAMVEFPQFLYQLKGGERHA